MLRVRLHSFRPWLTDPGLDSPGPWPGSRQMTNGPLESCEKVDWVEIAELASLREAYSRTAPESSDAMTAGASAALAEYAATPSSVCWDTVKEQASLSPSEVRAERS